MLDIKDIVTEICDCKNQLEDIKLKIRNEIEETKEYLNKLEELEVYECLECGREICYSEYDENDGYCNNCNY